MAQVLGKQMLRSGTSVGAHYREATRARSPQSLLVSWRVDSRSWKKLFIGWSCCWKQVSLVKQTCLSYFQKRRN